MQGMEIGLLVLDIVLFVAVIMLLLTVQAIRKRVSKMERRYGRFMRGKDMRGMEETVVQRFAEVDDLKKSTKLINQNLAAIGETCALSFQKYGLVKYDAFEDAGGNLSFALALLTKQNNGFVLNCVHGKEGSYTYAKEIVNGEAYVALGAEEQEALKKAKELDDTLAS